MTREIKFSNTKTNTNHAEYFNTCFINNKYCLLRVITKASNITKVAMSTIAMMKRVMNNALPHP